MSEPNGKSGDAGAQAIAEAASRALFAEDAVLHGFGMQIESVGPGRGRISMTVRADMLNGFRICHGGVMTTLADTAFGLACNSHDAMTVASGLVVDFLAPAHEGDRLTAECREVSRAGRTGVYDITEIGRAHV